MALERNPLHGGPVDALGVHSRYLGDALDKIDWNRGCYPLVCRKLVYLLFAGINREIELAGNPRQPDLLIDHPYRRAHRHFIEEPSDVLGIEADASLAP
jgi:hypothetical protein